MLQYVAVCCSVLQCDPGVTKQVVAVSCNVLQRGAVCYNVLQA